LFQVALSPDESGKLRRSLEELKLADGSLVSVLAALIQASCHLPPSVLTGLLRFRAGVDTPGTMLIRGLPVEVDLPPTPTADTGGPAAGALSERVVLLVAGLLGEPVAYRAEKNGILVQDLFPVREFESEPANEGSATTLDFHTELTFSRLAPERPLHVTSPDFVLLLGLRCPADRAATTVTVQATDVCARLGESQLRVLREPQYQLRAPHSFTRDGGGRPWSPPVPLLRGSSEAPWLAFDSACGVRALSPEAEGALDALRAACEDPSIQTGVQLGEGEMLIIDNNRCAHSRSPFPARFDGEDRWLRRTYVRRSIWDLQFDSSPSSRVLV
jgi:L-asparagine oxygenase